MVRIILSFFSSECQILIGTKKGWDLVQEKSLDERQILALKAGEVPTLCKVGHLIYSFPDINFYFKSILVSFFGISKKEVLSSITIDFFLHNV